MAVKHGLCLLALEKKIQAFETKSLRKLFGISYLEHKTNDWVQSKINFLVGPREPFLAIVKRRKLAWFGHVTRHDSLSKTILLGTLRSARRRDRQRKCWMDNIKEWTFLLTLKGLLQKDWKRISAESSVTSPQQPTQSRV